MRVRLVDVDQVIDRMEHVLHQRVPDDPEPPSPPPRGHGEPDPERQRESSGVARVVVVAHAERPDLAEEGPGVAEHVRAEDDVPDRQRDEHGAGDVPRTYWSRPLHVTSWLQPEADACS